MLPPAPPPALKSASHGTPTPTPRLGPSETGANRGEEEGWRPPRTRRAGLGPSQSSARALTRPSFRFTSRQDAKNLVFLMLQSIQAKKVTFECQVNKRGTLSLFGVFVSASSLGNLTSVAPTASNSLRPRLRD